MADSETAQPPRLADASGQVILVLRNLLAERYPDLGAHVNTVARLCAAVAPQVGFPDNDRTALTQAAFLHDIGKLSLPESILSEVGPLSDAEWRLIWECLCTTSPSADWALTSFFPHSRDCWSRGTANSMQFTVVNYMSIAN